MSTAIIRIPRPTRIELLRLKKRLNLARRFHSLLRDREVYLLEVFRETLKSLIEARRRLNSQLLTAYTSYYNSLYIHGTRALEGYASTVPARVSLQLGYKNIMGVWTYTYKLTGAPEPAPSLPLELAELQRVRGNIVELVAEIAEYEKALVNIGAEIVRLKRVVSMLEKIYIPRLERTIRYLSMKFDEMRREETIRAIKVKKKITSA
jgi:V/A-type H+-transporting ATPase subunit D